MICVAVLRSSHEIFFFFSSSSSILPRGLGQLVIDIEKLYLLNLCLASEPRPRITDTSYIDGAATSLRYNEDLKVPRRVLL